MQFHLNLKLADSGHEITKIPTFQAHGLYHSLFPFVCVFEKQNHRRRRVLFDSIQFIDGTHSSPFELYFPTV